MIRNDDAIGETCRIGQLRAAEAAIDDRDVGEIARQRRRPVLDRGTADEQHAVLRRRMRSIVRGQRIDVGLPSRDAIGIRESGRRNCE